MGQLTSSHPSSSLPDQVRTLCRLLREAGWRSWVVGGCTRDLLLNRPVHDWDIATDARPEHVMRVFHRVIPTGLQHGTVTVMLGKQSFEVTTLRGEGAYSDGRHPDEVTFVDDLREDLARRDFTINAIALDPTTGDFSDPFDGIGDLKRRLIRAVGDPVLRFSEDGLRLLRAARFSAVLGFDIEPATVHGMRESSATLAKVSAERVRDELLKSLRAEQPSLAFEVMRHTNLLPIILPELVPSIGCAQNRYHRYDVWTHTMRVVDACIGDEVLRFAALLHDVGKPAVRELSDKTKDYTFYQHEVVGARTTHAVCTRLKLSNEQRERVVDIVRNHLVVYEDSWSDAALRRWVQRVGEGRVEDILALANADAHGKGVDATETLDSLVRMVARLQELKAQGLALTVRSLAIDGNDLMTVCGVAPGRVVGNTLKHLLELVVDDPSRNERDRLLELAGEYLKQQASEGGERR